MALDFDTFRPPDDLVFQYLFEQATTGQVPVFGIVVDLARLVPFDPKFDPYMTSDGRSLIQAMMRDWKQGRTFQPWVYPRGEVFIVADDYAIFISAQALGIKQIACQCLGQPVRQYVHDCQGPLGVNMVRRAAGLA